jgi:hypothetical protein
MATVRVQNGHYRKLANTMLSFATGASVTSGFD